MKHLQKPFATMTLLVVLSFSAQAGEITTWGVAPPPPPPPASVTATEPTDATDNSTESATGSEPLLTELTLSLLQLLSVF